MLRGYVAFFQLFTPSFLAPISNSVRVSVKEASDLCGKVPYIPGMPVFGTENIATELGLSKSTSGALVSVTYQERNGRRYAVSATVDFPSYTGTPSDPQHPHCVILQPINKTIKFKLPNSEGVYSTNRMQLPLDLVPAFGFTSHNSQGCYLTWFA